MFVDYEFERRGQRTWPNAKSELGYGTEKGEGHRMAGPDLLRSSQARRAEKRSANPRAGEISLRRAIRNARMIDWGWNLVAL